MKTGILSPQELQSFEQNGFVVVRGMYSAAEIKNLSGWIEALVARGPVKGQEMFYLEDSLKEPGKRILSRVEKFTDYHPGFRAFVREEKMISRVSLLLGDEALLFKEKINFKLAGGGGFKPHQDIQPGWDDYAPYFISVLVTIDESTEANGCLELCGEGQHRRGLIGRKWEPLEGKELEGLRFVKYPMQPGDVAFFDCFVPHQSEPNLTDKARRNLYLTYNRKRDGDHREAYFAAKRKNYPPDNERDDAKVYTFRV